MIRIALFYGLLALACGYALRRGGAPERWVAAIFLAGTVATLSIILARGYDAPFFRDVELGFAIIDIVMLAVILSVALVADRYWPLWLAALQGFNVVGHLAKTIAPDILPDVYLAAQAFTAYPSLLLVMAATRLHATRTVCLGFDPSWSPSSLAAIRRLRATARIG